MIFLNLTKQEIEIAATLLDMASEQFSNHGCNDFEFPESWTQQQCDDFTLAMHKWNGDPEEHEPGSRFTMDWFAMDFLAAKLRSLLPTDK